VGDDRSMVAQEAPRLAEYRLDAGVINFRRTLGRWTA
jgi:hypothetical protein